MTDKETEGIGIETEKKFQGRRRKQEAEGGGGGLKRALPGRHTQHISAIKCKLHYLLLNENQVIWRDYRMRSTTWAGSLSRSTTDL